MGLTKESKKEVKRGMVVLKSTPKCAKQFDAQICVLKGECATITCNYQTFLHILHVKQSASIRKIEILNDRNETISSSSEIFGDGENVVLRAGNRAKVQFEFSHRPEYIREGMRIIFRDGTVRGIGKITKVYS